MLLLVFFRQTIILIAIIVGFNILVGLLPVHNVIRKTPARILSGNSVN